MRERPITTKDLEDYLDNLDTVEFVFNEQPLKDFLKWLKSQDTGPK